MSRKKFNTYLKNDFINNNIQPKSNPKNNNNFNKSNVICNKENNSKFENNKKSNTKNFKNNKNYFNNPLLKIIIKLPQESKKYNNNNPCLKIKRNSIRELKLENFCKKHNLDKKYLLIIEDYINRSFNFSQIFLKRDKEIYNRRKIISKKLTFYILFFYNYILLFYCLFKRRFIQKFQF
jgi:hypothetical protein